MKRCFGMMIGLGIAGFAGGAAGATMVFYDAGLGTLPTAQGMLYGESPAGGGVASMNSGAAWLDTTGSLATRAGWAPGLISKESATGYTVSLTCAIASESHQSTDRAGTDLLVISNDSHRAIELAFWPDRIFALNSDVPAFTHGEEALLDTTVMRDYQLSIQGAAYTLYDGATAILTGPLRDYTTSTVTLPSLPLPVYQIPNLLFVGDDTASAQGILKLERLALTDAAVTPEPASLSLLAGGMLLALRRRRSPFLLSLQTGAKG